MCSFMERETYNTATELYRISVSWQKDEQVIAICYL